MRRVSEYSRLGQEVPLMEIIDVPVGPAATKSPAISTIGKKETAMVTAFLIGAIVGGFIGAIGKGLTSKYVPLVVKMGKR